MTDYTCRPSRTTTYGSPQRWSSTSFPLALLLPSIFFISLFSLTQAQTNGYRPLVVRAPAFARTVNKLYIIGGMGEEETNFYYIPRFDQFMSLDLAIPWNATSPSWTELAAGPIEGVFPVAFSSNEQTLYILHTEESNSPLQYNVQDNTWQDSPRQFKFSHSYYEGISAVSDPRTGLIYLAGGYHEVQGYPPHLKVLDIFDPVTQSIHTIKLPNPTEVFPARQFYGNVWSKHLNSIVYWGGENTSYIDRGLTLNGVTTLPTDTLKWSTMATQGAAPEKKLYHCMAANEEGTMLAIYGGKDANLNVVGELWVLDLVTSTWRQGRKGPPRAFAACTIAGDQFLIWGGSINKTVNAPAEMIIYSFSTSTYVKQYTPPAFYKDLKAPPPISRTTEPRVTDEQTPLPVGAAVGGAVAGLLLVGAIAGLFILRRRQNQGLDKRFDESRDRDAGRSRGLRGVFQQWRGGGGLLFKGAKKDPVENDEDEVLERTLKELEEEHKELEHQRQRLVLQNHESNSQSFKDRKRGPTAFTDNKAEVVSSPTLPTRHSPDEACTLRSLSPENLNDRRTVQAVSGIVNGYHGGGYVGPRGESALAQEAIEPLYGPSPEVNNAIPDLIYVPPPNVGMDWTKQQQENHPHTLLDPSVLQYEQSPFLIHVSEENDRRE